MVTIRDLLEIVWSITRLDITAYSPDPPQRLHRWIFGEGIRETTHMYHDRQDGILTIVDMKINAHGEATKSRGPEIGWGVKEKLFPKELLDSKITHLNLCSRGGWEGQEASITVEMQRLTAEILKKQIIGTREDYTDECTEESADGAWERTDQAN